ncbi:major facilitator superfamily protein [Bacillus sp. 1NLA3E]|nr:major facilitator superfamily protein [Bacillus sp. 1NLA3E]
MKISKMKYFARLLVLGFANPTIYVLPYLYYTWGNQMLGRYHTDLTTLAGLVGIYGIIALITYVPSGILVDIFGPKRLSIFSYITTTALILVSAFVTNISVLRIIYIALGFTTILTFWSPWITSVARAGGLENQTKSFGFTYTFVGLGGIVVNTILVKIIGNTSSGIQSGLIVLAIITAIIGVLYVFLFKDIDILEGEDDENAKFKFSRVIEAIKIPGLWYAAFVVFAFYSLLTTTSVFNQLLTNTYGMSNEQASFIAVFRTNGLGLIAGPALVFVVSRFKSTGKTLLATAIVEAVFVAAIMLLPKSTSYVMPAMIVVLSIAFLQLGARAIYFGQIGEAGIPDHILGTASGIISLIAYSSDIYMPQLVAGMITDKAGKIISSGYHTVYMLQFGLLAMVVVFSLLVWRESKKSKAKLG